MRTRTILLSLMAALVAGSLQAAEKVTVKLKDGSTIEGLVVSETDEEITIKAAGLKLAIDREDIAELRRPEKPKADPAEADTPAKEPAASGDATGPKAAPEPGAAKDDEKPGAEEELSKEVKARIDALLPKLSAGHDEKGIPLEERVDIAAAEALRKIRGPGVDSYYLKKYGAAQGSAKLHLAVILAERKAKAVLPGLMEALDSTEVKKVPPAVLTVLATFKDEKATALLVKLFKKEKDPNVQINLMNAMSLTEDWRVLPHVLPYMEHPHVRVRGTARILAIKFGRKIRAMTPPPFDVLDVLLQQAERSKHPDNYAMVFAYVFNEKTDDAVIKMLDASERATLRTAVFAAGERRLGAASSKLLGVLRSPNTYWRTRIDAAVALQKIKDMGTVPGMISAAANEKIPMVRGQIYKSLKAMTGQGKLPSSAAAWRKWWEKEGSKL